MWAGNDVYRKCDECQVTMTGIMKVSGDIAPRKLCKECEKHVRK